MTVHEIKGAAFVTLQRLVTTEHGAENWSALVAAMPPAHGAQVQHAHASDWFDEEVHASVLRATFETVAARDVTRYEQVIDAGTTLGVHTFARLILGMSSPAFVVRRCPTLWTVIRRGPARVSVEQPSEGRSIVRYERFPFFDDVLYRHYFRALLGAVVRPALGRTPIVSLLAHTANTLDVEIRH